jgi:FMN phosphatase YigB (HAD superfamily)
MISVIIFDLAEVILSGLLGVEEKISRKLNMEATEILNKLNNEHLIKLFKGKISEDEYWNLVLKETSWNVDIDLLKKLIRENFREIEGTRAILIRLKNNNNIKLGLLSVHAKEWIEYCEEKFDFHSFFDATSYSYENSLCKPDKEAYLDILNKLDAYPEESLFIDDSLKNIEAAKGLGMLVIQFIDATQLEHDLKNFQFKIY